MREQLEDTRRYVAGELERIGRGDLQACVTHELGSGWPGRLVVSLVDRASRGWRGQVCSRRDWDEWARADYVRWEGRGGRGLT